MKRLMAIGAAFSVLCAAPMEAFAAQAYPELAEPPAARELAAYRYGIETGAVVLVNGEVITDGAPVKTFDQSVRAGRDARLTVYQIDYGEREDGPFYWLRCSRFQSRGGTVTLSEGSRFDQDKALRYGQAREIRYAGLNDYGRLCYDDPEQDAYQVCLKAVNERELFPDYEERVYLTKTYLSPVYPVLRAGREWETPEGGEWLWLFQRMAEESGMDLNAYHDEEDSTRFVWPVPVMLRVLRRHFPALTREALSAAVRQDGAGTYLPALDAIETGSANGYYALGDFPWPRAVSLERDGERLTLHYELYDSYSGQTQSRWVMTLRCPVTGDFSYVSNRLSAPASPDQ